MKKSIKTLTGAAAAALVTLSAAAPAEAQRYRHYDRDRGIDAGDVIAGVAIVGGIAAIASAIGNSNRYGYGYSRGYGYGYPGYGAGYGYGPQAAVQACGYEAQRYGHGRVSIIDVDQRNARRFRVHGVIDGNGGYYDRGYGRIGFTCTARDDGRVTNFRTDRY